MHDITRLKRSPDVEELEKLGVEIISLVGKVFVSMAGQGRLKQSRAHALITGATVANPQRYTTPEPKLFASKPLGSPPETMTLERVVIWYELKARYPHLRESDGILVEQICALVGRLRTIGLDNAGHNTLLRALAHIGATPTTRSRVSSEAEELEDDDFSEFMN